EEAKRAKAYLMTLCETHGREPSFALTVEEAIPAHAGLGSGTQLALAIGKAFALMENLPLTTTSIAGLLSRGARSGIGVGALHHGGLLLDGGRGPRTIVPPMLSRLPFPEDWRILLILDPAARGVHGPEERRAFQTLPPLPASTAAHLCRLTLMRAL